jgi:REP element-mobilizing transposase RayT
MSEPLAYFLTWHTYGTWLPGHLRGWVDAEHDEYGTPFAPADPERLARSAADLAHEPLTLDAPRRQAVQAAIIEVCRYRQWTLLAVHVRTTHVHAVVAALVSPEKVMNDFKAYATRRLRREGLAATDGRVWSVHGSTRYFWKEEQLSETVASVVDRQGIPLQPAPFDYRNQSPERERRVLGSDGPSGLDE